MNILLISQYFFPETGATSNRIYSLAKYFNEQDITVRVIAEKPNHPKGIFFEGYEKGIFIDDMYKEIPVTYTWVKTKPEKGFLGRILFYISFMFMAIIAAWRSKEKYDIVIASSPPLFVGISGWFAAKIKNAKFVFDVRDLWPDVAIAMGELNNKLAVRIAEYIELFIYNNADLITTVTKSFKNTLVQKGITEAKIGLVANGTDPELFKVDISQDELHRELELPSKFIVAYVGNHGLAQGLKHIIDAAEDLDRNSIDDIHFLMVGGGPKKQELIRMAERAELTNITFIDRVSLQKAARYMNAVNALLVPLADDSIYSQFIPSKLFDSMAASKPVLLSVAGESREILDRSQAGLFYKAEDSEELIENLLRLKQDRPMAKKMGENGRYWVDKNYSREVQARRMHNFIKNLIY